MDQEYYLRGICIADEKKLKLPRKLYLDALMEVANVRRPSAEALVKTYKENVYDKRKAELETLNLNVSPLRMGLFNAVIDTEKTIDMKQLLIKILDKKLVNENDIKVLKVSTIYGKFKKAFEMTQEYGEKVYKKIRPSEMSSIEFILKVGNTGASFTIFKTGRVRFSGGYVTGTRADATKLVNFMKKHYFDASNNEIRINNNTTQFRIGFGFKSVDIFTILDKALTKNLAYYKDYSITAEFEPERNNTQKKKSPFLYIQFKGPKTFTLLCAPQGSIQIEGTLDVRESYDVSSKFLEVLKNSDLLKIIKIPNVIKDPKPSKISRRFNMMPAPNVTRRGTTCPLGKRPVPYSFQGKCPEADHYVRPNPQGQPCCYKVPKKKEYIRSKVIERYEKAGVRVPDSVRNLFKFGANTNNKPTNVSNNTGLKFNTHTNKEKGFKIGSRQCMRFTKVGLVDIAMKMGIQVPRVINKAALCKLIEEESKKIGKNKTNNRIAHMENGRLKLKNRFCDTYKKSTLVKFARVLKLEANTSMTKAELCKMISDVYNK